MKNSVFKSKEGRDKFRAYYGNVLSQFPFKQRYIETNFGQTFILSAGQESNPPIILLHGSCSNSAFWFPEIMTLSQNFMVYAVDIIGEAGNSEEYRPDLKSEAFALWIKDVLDALELKEATLIGNSLGGWMALKFATTFPEKVSNLILIASSGLAQVRPQFLLNSEKIFQMDGTIPVSSDIIGEQNIPKEVLDFMNLIVESYKPVQELPLYPDEQLKRLNIPILFIAGEDDVIIDAQKSAQRLSHLIPTVEIHLLPNTGHVISNSVEYIIPFLTKT